MEKYCSPLVADGELVSFRTKTSKISLSCYFPLLMAVERKLTEILKQEFNYIDD